MITSPQVRRRRRLITTALITVAVLVYGAILYVLLAIPDYRTTLLIDTAAGVPAETFNAITNSVASAAQNTASTDALSLRRFGGNCGDPHNTTEIVRTGTNHGQQIADAVHTLTMSGSATLLSGILAAIDDYSGYYPFRGSKRNRIIVVSSHGVDACTADQIAVREAIAKKSTDSDLNLDFRFVGYKVPQQEQQSIIDLAAVIATSKPRFVATAADLSNTLKEFTIPTSPNAREVSVPPSASSAPSSQVPSSSTPTAPTPSSSPPTSRAPSRNLNGTFRLSNGTMTPAEVSTEDYGLYTLQKYALNFVMEPPPTVTLSESACVTTLCDLTVHHWLVMGGYGTTPTKKDVTLKALSNGNFKSNDTFSPLEFRLRSSTLIQYFKAGDKQVTVTWKVGPS
jgi:hypothetical protein